MGQQMIQSSMHSGWLLRSTCTEPVPLAQEAAVPQVVCLPRDADAANQPHHHLLLLCCVVQASEAWPAWISWASPSDQGWGDQCECCQVCRERGEGIVAVRQ